MFSPGSIVAQKIDEAVVVCSLWLNMIRKVREVSSDLIKIVKWNLGQIL